MGAEVDLGAEADLGSRLGKLGPEEPDLREFEIAESDILPDFLFFAIVLLSYAIASLGAKSSSSSLVVAEPHGRFFSQVAILEWSRVE